VIKLNNIMILINIIVNALYQVELNFKLVSVNYSVVTDEI